MSRSLFLTTTALVALGLPGVAAAATCGSSVVGGNPVRNAWTGDGQIPATTELSDKVSADLKRRGFKFVGSTIVYAFIQAAGLVNDHLVSCFRYQEVNSL